MAIVCKPEADRQAMVEYLRTLQTNARTQYDWDMLMGIILELQHYPKENRRTSCCGECYEEAN